MTTCETCSHTFSWKYTMILRANHTFRPWQETFLRAVPTPLIKLVWMSLRAVFGKGGNVHFLMSGFLTLSKNCLNQKLYTAFSSNENAKKATVQPANYWSRAWLLQPSRVLTVWWKWQRSRTISHWTSPEAIREETDWLSLQLAGREKNFLLTY